MDYNLSTAEEIYKAVLDGIKKESTAVLTPEAFNRLINFSALTEWLEQKAPKGDFDQNFIDSLRNLIRFSPIIKKDAGRVAFKLPKDYFRLQSVMFRLKPNIGDGGWVRANRMTSDSYSVVASGVNPYRKPQSDRVYYMQEGNYVLNIPENKEIDQAKFIYYARPEPIVFNPEGNNKNGSLNKEQNKEVVDIAVRIFLERVKEERYQTQLTEEQFKAQKRISHT